MAKLTALFTAAGLVSCGVLWFALRWRWWPLGRRYTGALLGWSWGLALGAAAAALSLVLFAAHRAGALSSAPPVLAAGLAAGFCAAAAIGAEREREDRKSPRAELRRRARRRIGPREVRRRRARRRRFERSEVSYAKRSEGEIALGRDRRGEPAYLSRSQFERNGLITGTTGSGKTWSAYAISEAAVLGAGLGLIFAEAKGDPDTRRRLTALALRSGRPMWVFDLAGQGQRWNPLASVGGAVERRDLLFRALEHSFADAPEYYAGLFREHALMVFRALEAAGVAVTVSAARRAWAPRRLAQLAGRARRRVPEVEGHYRALADNERRRQEIESVGGRLAELDDAAGHLLEPGSEAEPTELIDLGRIMRCGGICLISLEAQTYPSVTRSVGQLLVADVAASCAPFIAAGERARCLVVLDEFGRYAGESVQALMALTARQAGVAVILATQDPADLDNVGEHFREQIAANVAWFLGHLTANPDSADWLARVASQREVVESTRQVNRRDGALTQHLSGLGTEAYGREWAIHPQEIQALGVGQAALVRKAPHDARVIDVYRPRSVEELLTGAAVPEGGWSTESAARRLSALRRASV